MPGRIAGRGVGSVVGRGAVVGLGVVWWWAVLRLALAPGAGVLEAAMAAGGWGLSLLPVHCVARERAAGALGAGRWRRAWRAGGRGGVVRASADADAGASGGEGEGDGDAGASDALGRGQEGGTGTSRAGSEGDAGVSRAGPDGGSGE
ncbi:hypothetical protein ABZ397_27695 [Streptomyces sp. NPDC005876]|uniref:hypothetical protein n=1 Tax=Streptomyces sp. NPDC005876 TaxID=3157076 RepID=UPI00340F37FB